MFYRKLILPLSQTVHNERIPQITKKQGVIFTRIYSVFTNFLTHIIFRSFYFLKCAHASVDLRISALAVENTRKVYRNVFLFVWVSSIAQLMGKLWNPVEVKGGRGWRI